MHKLWAAALDSQGLDSSTIDPLQCSLKQNASVILLLETCQSRRSAEGRDHSLLVGGRADAARRARRQPTIHSASRKRIIPTFPRQRQLRLRRRSSLFGHTARIHPYYFPDMTVRVLEAAAEHEPVILRRIDVRNASGPAGGIRGCIDGIAAVA